jgi:DNA polymerase (family 10)
MQVTNSEIADIFKIIGNLLELHGENEFKARSYHTASFRLDKLSTQTFAMSTIERQSIEGIGKGIFTKIEEILATGTLKELEKLIEDTPPGVIQMMKIKGIGPKKVRQIWKQLEVESIGELLYACNENRLVSLSGFGEKTQQQIIKNIEFLQSNAGKLHFDEAEVLAQALVQAFQTKKLTLEMVGELARKCEIINSLDFLVIQTDNNWNLIHSLLLDFGYEPKEQAQETTYYSSSSHTLPLSLTIASPIAFPILKFQLQATPEFLDAIGFDPNNFTEEVSFFASKQLPYIIPEMRESKESLAWAGQISNPERIISFHDLKGCIHNHSTWSDGANSVAEMAKACQDLDLQYFVISDHSKTAVYAQGLSVERVAQQQLEIDALNVKYQGFKIYKSIESDILGDGSLDYDSDVLKTFDLVIASVHSNLKMEEERATQRLLKAIENPFTRILGHPTGRLLLSRPGYPIDHKKIIDACAANKVVIELNSHPYRLDLDWRWIHYAQEKGVPISINPDAHEIAGVQDMRYGVNVARKAGLLVENTLNALPLDLFENWVRNGK